jgi:hypothetical protein
MAHSLYQHMERDMLSKTDQRNFNMLHASAKAAAAAGHHSHAQNILRGFVASAPTDAVAQKRKAAVANVILDVLPVVA